MRIAFIGAGEITVRTAELLIARGHEVIIIENNPEKIEELSDILDCSFLNETEANRQYCGRWGRSRPMCFSA